MILKSVKRRFITLIEMMIVMFLIALITGVIAYNYKGSLDEGKAFKTKTGIEKLQTILNLEIAKRPDLRKEINTHWRAIVESSPLVHDPQALEKDGWGDEYHVEYDEQKDSVSVNSRRFDEYKDKHPGLFGQ